MHSVDWWIVGGFVLILAIVTLWTWRYTKSVADFLAANRCAGRYLLTTADAMVGLGAISIISFFEIYYEAGFTAQWWNMMITPFILFTTLSGWVVYRFRQTRCLTLMQFFELRYNKSFRIFFAIISFVSSMVGIGIMPAVAARFFLTFCGFGQTMEIAGMTLSVFPILMAVIMLISLFFTFSGGHITVMITDFLQGIFSNIVFLLLLVVLMVKFPWSKIIDSLALAPPDASMLRPLHTGGMKNFGIWFFLVQAFNYFFVYPTWLGNQAYKSAAKNAHEARMALVLGNVRGIVIYTVIMLLPICAYMVMHHPDFSGIAASVTDQLQSLDDESAQRQMITPMVMSRILPVGVVGAFCAVMFAAFISTSDTILHAYGSILIQDIILPFRKKPFSPRTHMFLLRAAIIAVAIFIYCFSLLFRQTQHIVMHWAIVGSIYYGAAAAGLIGGLYWSRGTTAGCWAAGVAGLVLGTGGTLIYQVNPDFPITGQTMSFWIAMIVFALYVGVSLLDNRIFKRKPFDMDKLLHRGQYTVKQDQGPLYEIKGMVYRLIGVGKEFSGKDKFIYIGVLGYSLLWFFFFVVVTIVNGFIDLSQQWWSTFWRFSIYNTMLVGTIVTIWLLTGGIKDLMYLFRTLSTLQRDQYDDGMVLDGQNLEDRPHQQLPETKNNENTMEDS